MKKKLVPSKSKLDEANRLFAHGGEMGALMRSTDWSKTKLGPVETWPKSLKTMLGVVLGSRFPMLLWWGPDLLHLYNDAYRPILRDKHPASLAAPAAEIWAEVWDVAGPMARSVQEGGPATWTEDLRLFINSGGMAEETYFTFSYSPVPGDEGRVGGILNTVQETTAKVQSERQIRMLHDLAARAADAKSEEEACRIATEVLSSNEADLPFVRLYTANEAGANPASWPFAEAARTSHEILVDERAIVLPLFRAGQPEPSAYMVAGISPHRAFDDRYQRFFRATAEQVANVISNARAYEAEKKRAEALAEIDRAKTTFFSNVSHEFRTPLTLILGPVEDALAKPGQALEGDNLKAVHRSAMRMLRLVNRLLDFARIEAGRLTMTFVPTDLSRLTAELSSSFRSLVERAGLTLSLDCPSMPEPVNVDPEQWEKIVLNLLSNAFKFTFNGEIAVRLRRCGDQIELTVRDTGGGIPKNELPNIFKRFHRVEGAIGRSFEGTGIGLSLVQELVKLHGGTVNVSSVEGEGSTFRVSIPADNAQRPIRQPDVDPVPKIAGGSSSLYLMEASQWIEAMSSDSASLQDDLCPGSGKSGENSLPEPAHILLVDDNADMRSYLARLLSARWSVEVAVDGQAALSSVRAVRPDLVLSDVMMPNMDGFSLLRELRADPATRDIPIVLLSARAGEESLLNGLEKGADDYLVKPFSTRELMARVQTHLDMARVRRRWIHELEEANKELEGFSYSVSHDLRAPLRSIKGFAQALVEDGGDRLDDVGRSHIQRVKDAAGRMSTLIEDMLTLSRLSKKELNIESVDLSELAQDVLRVLWEQHKERRVDFLVAPGCVVKGDRALLRSVLENLIGNAWKFTSKRKEARIEFGTSGRKDGKGIYFVRDNGAGFDMAYAGKLFGAFQRLHVVDEFPGTGVGLATVRRIINRHGGTVWAEAKVDSGATFFFTL